MAVSASTMKCPACDEQILDTLSTSFGTWERCPNCTGIFIRQELVASASADRAGCEEALGETEGLLLPTERSCPKCLQKLFDGRVQSRGVILSLCPTCKSIWTNLPTLSQLEEAIGKKLAAETQASGVSEARANAGATESSFLYEDTALSRLFRVFARLFDRVADNFRSSPYDEDDILEEEEAAKKKKKQEEKAAKTAKPVKPVKPEKLIQSVEPAPPASASPTPAPPQVEAVKPVEPVAEAPQIDIPEFIFPEEPVKVILPEPKPAQAPVPVPKTAILSGPAPKPGLFARLKAAWSPKPKKGTPKAAPVTQPVESPKPTAVEVPKPALAPKSAKPAPAPKPKKERAPHEPFDHVAFWPPWILGIAGVLLSGLRDYGYEGVPAFLWGIMGWSIGMMFRIKRLYRSPVVLKGQIVPAREEDPKGILVFKQDEKTFALNKLGRWDVIPRLFGLSNPRQLPKGDATLTGWYRPGLVPAIEVHEVRADKVFRKSMTRALRWAFAIVVFVAALGIYLSLD